MFPIEQISPEYPSAKEPNEKKMAFSSAKRSLGQGKGCGLKCCSIDNGGGPLAGTCRPASPSLSVRTILLEVS